MEITQETLSSACAALIARGKGNNVTIADIRAMLTASLSAEFGGEEQPRYTTRRLREEIAKAEERGRQYERETAGAQVQDVERYRHKKRGTEYSVIARGRLQVDGDLDNEKVVIYRGDDGQTWVRPEYEFNDGRFEQIPATAATKQDVAGTIEDFEKDFPELYWHIAKGKIAAGEPLYGSIIIDILDREISHGESDVSAVDAFRIAVSTANLPAPTTKPNAAENATPAKPVGTEQNSEGSIGMRIYPHNPHNGQEPVAVGFWSEKERKLLRAEPCPIIVNKGYSLSLTGLDDAVTVIPLYRLPLDQQNRVAELEPFTIKNNWVRARHRPEAPGPVHEVWAFTENGYTTECEPWAEIASAICAQADPAEAKPLHKKPQPDEPTVLAPAGTQGMTDSFADPKLLIIGSEGIVGRRLMSCFPSALTMDATGSPTIRADILDCPNLPDCDVVIMLACASNDPNLGWETQSKSLRMAEIVIHNAAAKGIPVIYASSVWAERHPLNCYGAVKRCIEQMVDSFGGISIRLGWIGHTPADIERADDRDKQDAWSDEKLCLEVRKALQKVCRTPQQLRGGLNQ
ncbi:hypothetical protein ACQZ6B_01110 [Agrobacterium vitis]